MATKEKDLVTREVASQIGKELRECAEKLFAKYGLEIQKANTKFGDQFEFKIVAVGVDLDENGINLNSPEAQYYSRFGYEGWLGSTLESRVKLVAPLGTKFTVNGTEYAFAGVEPRKKKFPILAVRVSDKKRFGFAENVIPTLNEKGGK